MTTCLLLALVATRTLLTGLAGGPLCTRWTFVFPNLEIYAAGGDRKRSI